jgi:hypothetical protein
MDVHSTPLVRSFVTEQEHSTQETENIPAEVSAYNFTECVPPSIAATVTLK